MSKAANPNAPLQIFRPGRHTAMGGQVISFSEADLQATVAAYDPAKHEAPLVVGHPRHDLPAYGWVQALAFSEGGLDATPAQVNTDFADMVAAGAFKKISASFYLPDAANNPVPGVYYLRHVGFLGAQAPAVKGLRSPAFADAEEGVVTFGEQSPLSTNQESTVTEEEAAQLRTQSAQQAARIAELEAAQTAAARAAVHARNVAFCEGLKTPYPAAHTDAVVATLDHLDTLAEPLEFGEGDARAPLGDKLRDMLKALPPMVDFGEAATRERAAAANKDAAGADAQFAEYNTDPERLAKNQAIQAYMVEHKTDYATAAHAVMR